jgi:50S ribosomal protein L16 3-hydroxylase
VTRCDDCNKGFRRLTGVDFDPQSICTPAARGKRCVMESGSYNRNMKRNPLGAFGAKRFMREIWQNRPLVLRAAAPQLADALGRADLIDLACRDDVESRLVVGRGRTWQVRHGPFRRRDFAQLPPRDWTLLVNGVETLVPAARALQIDFGFIPYARHDDVMVSYAAPGGGVGPHFDSYDVFLLQGAGTRRWQISNQRNLELIDGAPLKILQRFRAQREFVMKSGDLLYLPPAYAHHGVAVGECLTWSVGTRALHQHEVTARFLDYLHDHLDAGGIYRGAEPEIQSHRAAIGPHMRRAVRGMIAALQWRDADIDRCLGEILSEPRQNVVFTPPRGIGKAAFARACKARGVSLDLRSRMLFDRNSFFINGESITVDAGDARALRPLADDCALAPGSRLGPSTLALLYRWYRAGYVALGIGPEHDCAPASISQAQRKRR